MSANKVALNSRICAGFKGKQKKNAAIPHGVNGFNYIDMSRVVCIILNVFKKLKKF